MVYIHYIPKAHCQLFDAHLHAVNNVCRRTANFPNKQATFRRAFACREQRLQAHGQLCIDSADALYMFYIHKI